MTLKEMNPRKSLNKAFLKMKPVRAGIDSFKENLISLLDHTNDRESEEFHKNLVSDFLKKTYYEPSHYINTKGRNDLVIHNGNSTKSPVAVILETKKPGNSGEMLSVGNINVKAFHELLLYYLRERITQKNLEVKHLIATNIQEWFIFDAVLFERLFAQNKTLVQQFTDFEEGRMADTKTDFFYRQIAQPFIETIGSEIAFTYFKLADYDKPLRNADKTDDATLIALYKLLSPEHLLKLPFANDSNSLDKRFYGELLHLIGLSETKNGGKKIIGRNKTGERNTGSLLEDAIIQLDSLDKLSRLHNPAQYGAGNEERLFNIALELSITWINRILFLKLLEAQLVTYHRNDKSYTFLHPDKIRNYDDLNSLFFQVLARRHSERNEDVRKIFEQVPYLNSSLFEPTELEQATLFISNLKDDKALPVFSQTVLKDRNGKKLTGSLTTIDYLFRFLDAYDFSSEGPEEIQEDNKTLINASVLGLIFEKINGYKDGSFFTPGFITMYMCRETIRRAVVQKFNDAKGWNCEKFDDLHDKIENTQRAEANEIVNSLKICDPAVGSGHFLVSALNEMIAIKNDLRILQDREGKRLKQYQVEVVNDELIVTDEDGDLFEYRPTHKESQRVQETLFHEKQTIIENCLFGVDINANSVKICRLRLWIELLKNAYYKAPGELETLPNIDINIKCGNSLVSRFALNADLRQALRKSKWTIDSYRLAVATYRNAENKEQKRQMEKLIANIKSDFRSEISQNDPRMKKLAKLKSELSVLTSAQLFEMTPKEKADWDKKVRQITAEAKKTEDEIKEIKANKIFENAFEWRFEFPEVLNDEGDFVGFDVVIGNPPYIRQEEIKELKSHFKSQFKMYSGTADVYIFFIEKGFEVLKHEGVFAFIMPNKFMQAGYGRPARKFLLEYNLIEIIDFGDVQVFEGATTYPCILIAGKEKTRQFFRASKISSYDITVDFPSYIKKVTNKIKHQSLTDETWVISNSGEQSLLQKIVLKSEKLEDYIGQMGKYGIKTGLTEAFVVNETIRKELIAADVKSKKLLRPFLLGRDVSPYQSPSVTNWLIFIPKGFTIKRNLPLDDPNRSREPPPRYGNMGFSDAWKWFQNEYPAIAKHLERFKDKAEARTDKGDFWWELRACDYYSLFEKPKIMYQKFQVRPCFIFNDTGTFCNDSMWFIPSSDKTLLGIFNSKMGWWLISKYCTAIQNGYQLIWKYFSQIPIATGNEKLRRQITTIVDKVLEAKQKSPPVETSDLENQIDQLVYNLYNLTEDEILIVEGTVG